MDNPNNFFNFFSPDTKKVLLNCQKISQDTKSAIGTDHLLLSLLITPKTKVQSILQKHLNPKTNYKLVLKIDEFSEKKTANNVTQEFKDILKLSADRSVAKNTQFILPEDLMLSIIEYKNCSAYKILKKLGINIDLLANDIFSDPQADFSNFIPFTKNQFSSGNSTGDPFGEFDMGNPLFINAPHDQNSRQSYLERFGTDLTKLAKEKKLDKLVGRNAETNRIIQILCRRTKNNPVLVGDPGVGKTAIVEGLAQKIVDELVPLKLIGKKIISIDLATAVAGTMYRGQYEDRIKKIIKEAKKDPNIILFIDEIHTMIGTGSAEGSMDTANILKPALSRGEIRLIGATTYEEYRRFIEKDAALERRLQKIKILEPSNTDTQKILQSTRDLLQKFHQVHITDDAIDTAIKLSHRYINDRHLPDKAIDILDEAAAGVHLTENPQIRLKIDKSQKQLSEVLKKKEAAIAKEDFPQAAYLRSQEIRIKNHIENLKKSHPDKTIISADKIAEVVSSWTHIPVDHLIKQDIKDLKNLSKNLQAHIIGQDEAIKKISQAIKKTKTKLTDPHRPLGSFMFLGPSGVGKTELAKILSQTLFSSPKKLIKIDMSEFMERHNVARLVGAPPGYVGYDDAGKLTEAVRNNPYSIILLDEIEKAHPEVSNILLQIMEDGVLSDAKGREVDFKNTIIIMTSNIGINDLNKHSSIGFEDKNDKYQYNITKDKISSELKKTFKPEFINRLDNIIFFNPLSTLAISKITKLELDKVVNRAKRENIYISYHKDVIDNIASASQSAEYGARLIRRNIDQYITTKISDEIIKNPHLKEIKIFVKNHKIILNTK